MIIKFNEKKGSQHRAKKNYYWAGRIILNAQEALQYKNESKYNYCLFILLTLAESTLQKNVNL